MAGQDNPFIVESHLEIMHILHAIMRESALITVNLDVNDFFLTSLLAIDESANCIYLERGHGRPILSNGQKSRRLSFNTTLDKVQIRFACEGIEATDYARREAYRIALPKELLRIQRREFYRVPTPIAAPIKCSIYTDEHAGNGSVELNICDIGCGGIAVQSHPTLFTPALGTCYSSIVYLPATAGLRIKVQARNAFMMTLRNGKITQRCGFAFLEPSEQMLATVQRYILALERQRRTHRS
jgi:flagellar brake protein